MTPDVNAKEEARQKLLDAIDSAHGTASVENGREGLIAPLALSRLGSDLKKGG